MAFETFLDDFESKNKNKSVSRFSCNFLLHGNFHVSGFHVSGDSTEKKLWYKSHSWNEV